MSTPDPMAEIRASFFVECEELLEALQDGLQELFDGSDDPEMVNVVFRAVHSIKGGAGAFGLEALVRFAHRYETVLEAVRSGSVAVDQDLLKLFFRAADQLSDIVNDCRNEVPVEPERGADLLTAFDATLGADVEAPGAAVEDIDFQPRTMSMEFDEDDAATAAYRIHFAPEAELFETGSEPLILIRALQELGSCEVTCKLDNLPPLDEIEPETPYLAWDIRLETAVEQMEIEAIFEFVEGLCTLTIDREVPASQEDPQVPPPPIYDEQSPAADVPSPPTPGTEASITSAQPAKPPSPKATGTKSVVRVDLDRIERLVNLVGELVINQAMLSQSLETVGLSPHSDAMHGLEEFQRLTRDIQDGVMMIRAQPVKSLFQRISRIVRETSAAVNKDVRLITEGETTEVDKTVIERLADPLTHMIRNAVDHGLETTEERIAAGKSPEGCVCLSATHKSGRVIIDVSDDGAGINRPRVLQIAIDKGLIPPDSVLTDSEIDNLLFLPGFSTAKKISDLSGRGVGMDVVKTAIQSLGGRITISSGNGAGTTFSISLPLTLAVLEGMVVHVAGETLVLPLNVVIETLTLSPDNLDEVRPGVLVVRVRGEFVPLFDLGHQLGYRERQDSYMDAVVLLIALEGGGRAAVIVDNIQDQRQVVIKGLDDSFYRAPGIAAATILGDGQIALILDPSDIIAQTDEAGTHEKTLIAAEA